MTRTKLTPTTITENIGYLAGLSQADLADRSVHELRKLLASCGVTQVTCLLERTSNERGIETTYTKGNDIRRAAATREECLQAIAEITVEKQLLARATEFNGKVLVDELPKRNWLVQAIVSGQYLGLEVAASLNESIMEDYPESHQFTTRAVMRSKYKGKLKATLKAREYWNVDSVQERYNSFDSALDNLGKEDNRVKNDIISQRRLERKERNRTTTTYTEFDVSSLLNWCERTLSKLPASSREWRKVALALAVATGRRCTSEILCSRSSAKRAGEYEIEFTGLAKEREDRQKQPIVVPTLVPATLVISGLEWLANMDKQETERDRAHARFSSDLTKTWREIANSTGVPVFTQLPEKEQRELHKVHGARKIYTNIVLTREGLTEDTAHPDVINARAQAILGHDEETTSAFYRLPMTITNAALPATLAPAQEAV